MESTQILIYVLFFCGLAAAIGIIMFFMALPYSWYGLKRRFLNNPKYGQILLLNKAGNFNSPIIIDMSKIGIEHSEKGYPLTREAFTGASFFGLPTAIYCEDDSKTTIGFVYQQTDKEGKPLYIEYTDKEGNTRKMPVYSELKPSKSIEPKVLKSLVYGVALSEIAKRLFGNTQNILYLCMGSIVVTGIVGFLVYTIHTQDIPNVLTQFDRIASICEAARETGRVVLQNATRVIEPVIGG
jgi:hypothetical protein